MQTTLNRCIKSRIVYLTISLFWALPAFPNTGMTCVLQFLLCDTAKREQATPSLQLNEIPVTKMSCHSEAITNRYSFAPFSRLQLHLPRNKILTQTVKPISCFCQSCRLADELLERRFLEMFSSWIIFPFSEPRYYTG